MKRLLLTFIIAFLAIGAHAQHTLKLQVTAQEDGTPLTGSTATILPINRTAVADSSGRIFFDNLPAGTYKISISYIGFKVKNLEAVVPLTSNQTLLVSMDMDEEEEEEEVIVTATRSSRSIRDIPTRVETISGEELAEKANMKPGDIRMLLNESTGIQTQQTSATSYNSSIRIQGLDGRYTQLLRDGLPLYAGFSGGLSLMQIAPLDLKQVEVIKGSSSTLYGGGAIAGLVNLVSKTPGEEKELSFLANGTSARGLDLSGFYSERFDKIGMTVFGSGNIGSAYDPASIGVTAIPKFERYTIHPRVFFYGDKTQANLGVSYVTENRLGGSMDYIKKDQPGYFERNNTERITAQVDIQHSLNPHTRLNFKNSYTHFSRKINIPAYLFDAVQQSSYTELNITHNTDRSIWTVGLNLLTDDLAEKSQHSTGPRDYHYNTWGMFIQHSWKPIPVFSVETGLRGDYVHQYGVELLPRVALMYKPNPALTFRFGGGMGYKTPSLFNEDAERIQFRDIQPINPQLSVNEKSLGANVDINYRFRVGELGVHINQLFFYTKLNRPLLLTASAGGYEFINAAGYIDTRGLETNLRLSYGDFKLFVGYTHANVNSHFNSNKTWFPLTAKHRLNNVLMYEVEEKWKLGLEAYYFSRQKLNDGSTGKPYWVCGFMAEKLWEKLSVFINFENILDTRQTRFDTIFTGTVSNPVFRDIYAPVDGFVTNGGVKWRL